MKQPARLLAIVCLISTGLAGCAPKSPPLPTYPLLSADESLRVLAERARSIRTVTAQGLLTLTRPDGESVRLDAALVMRPPTHTRIRAWKFGQAVFDLTLNEDGLYLLAPQQPSRAAEIKRAGVSAAELARAWALLTGGFFDDPTALVTDARGDELTIRRTTDGQTIACTVERRTLTPRRYTLSDPAGQERFGLTLSAYALVGDTPYPRRLAATSDTGSIVVALSEVELNTDLAPAAFQPPRRAERLP